jgi:hypothetical protein
MLALLVACGGDDPVAPDVDAGTDAGAAGTGGDSGDAGSGGTSGVGATDGGSGTGAMDGGNCTDAVRGGNRAASVDDAGGTDDAGGGGGIGGSGAVGGAGGIGGGGAVGGSGGIGGIGGIGGSGGTISCGTGPDIRTGAACERAAEGWFAIKTVLDVWWEGVPTRDPGRGEIELYQLGKLEGVCADGSNGTATMKPCGSTLPPFTSDVSCDAFQIEFPDTLWDSPNMPRFRSPSSTTGFNPGDILSVGPATGLLGIDLIDGAATDSGVWPTSMQTEMIRCEAGIGRPCYPDHDNDSFDGVTINVRHDSAVYTFTTPAESGISKNVTDSQYGKCTSGAPYKYRGAPVSTDFGPLGCADAGIRAISVRIGMRTRVGAATVINGDCASGVGDSSAQFLESRAYDCVVDPSTLPSGAAARPATGPTPANACTDTEAQFVDDNVPLYKVLAKNGVPGAAIPPVGWALSGRDIVKTASVGPRSAIVRIGGLTDAEPSCAAARGAAFPAL